MLGGRQGLTAAMTAVEKAARAVMILKLNNMMKAVMLTEFWIGLCLDSSFS